MITNPMFEKLRRHLGTYLGKELPDEICYYAGQIGQIAEEVTK